MTFAGLARPGSVGAFLDEGQMEQEHKTVPRGSTQEICRSIGVSRIQQQFGTDQTGHKQGRQEGEKVFWSTLPLACGRLWYGLWVGNPS